MSNIPSGPPPNGGRKIVRAKRHLEGEPPIKKNMDVEESKTQRVTKEAEAEGKELKGRGMDVEETSKSRKRKLEAVQSGAESVAETVGDYAGPVFKKVKEGVASAVWLPYAAATKIVGPGIRLAGSVAFEAAQVGVSGYEYFRDFSSVMGALHQGEIQEDPTLEEEVRAYREFIDSMGETVAKGYDVGVGIVDRNAVWVTGGLERFALYGLDAKAKLFLFQGAKFAVRSALRGLIKHKVGVDIPDEVIKILAFQVVYVFKQLVNNQKVDLNAMGLLRKNMERYAIKGGLFVASDYLGVERSTMSETLAKGVLFGGVKGGVVGGSILAGDLFDKAIAAVVDDYLKS